MLRAVKDGVPVAARDLGILPAQLYGWRAKAQQHGQDQEAKRLMQSEAARLKREVARLEEENAFLKKARRRNLWVILSPSRALWSVGRR